MDLDSFGRLSRRHLLLTAIAAAVGGAATAAPRRVEVKLRKFDIEPGELRVKQGEAVVLALSASDFVHGFAVPELSLRADVPPGQPVELALPTTRPGRYTVLCDNFCGEGHDRMMGTLVISGS